MSKPRVYVTRQLPGTGLDGLRDICDLHVWPGELPPPRETLLQEVAEAEGLIPLLNDRIDASVMDAAPKLRIISNYAVGYDNIDVAAATARGIPVGNTPGVLTETTAELAFALLLAAARRLPEGERLVRAGGWETFKPALLLGRDLYGATLGIIGLGRIGQAVARRAVGFSMRVLYHRGDANAAHQLGAESASLDDVLRQSDFISLHVPLMPETKYLIGARELALMKPTAILVNTARGGVVDPVALYEALRDGVINAAALDVTEPEPIPMDDPLLTLDNCLIVPHIGSASVATRERMVHIAVDNLLAGLRGERLPHCVNPEVYEGER
jgi:glyoxylate reductase